MVGELVACPKSSGGEVSHVLEDGGEDEDGLLSQLLLVLVQERPQEREAERVSGVTPELLCLCLGGRGAKQSPLSARHGATCLIHLPSRVSRIQTWKEEIIHLKFVEANFSKVWPVSFDPGFFVIVSKFLLSTSDLIKGILK